MKPTINITTSNNCKIYIEDTTEYYTTGGGRHRFRSLDMMSIDVLRLNKVLETIHKNAIISDKTDPIQIPIDVDGWFSIIRILLPSKKWFDETSDKNLYDVVYYTDGSKIYKYLPNISESSEEVPLGEILDLNLNARDYSVYYTEPKDYISICFLRQCYINLCKQIFSTRGFSSCWNKNTIDSELVYKRDLVWMAINVIKYLTELNLLAEVQRIIENIQGCNGLCTPTNVNKSSGCGCSK